MNYGPYGAPPPPQKSGPSLVVALGIVAAIVGIGSIVLLFVSGFRTGWNRYHADSLAAASASAASASKAALPTTTVTDVLDAYAHGSAVYEGQRVRVCGAVNDVDPDSLTLAGPNGFSGGTLEFSAKKGASDRFHVGDEMCATCTGRGVERAAARFDGCADGALGHR